MRAYLATTPKQVAELVSTGVAIFNDYLTPEQFDFPVEASEEEREDLIAQLASDDSDELNGGKGRFVLAVDLNDNQLKSDKIEIEKNQIAALLVGEELAWFAPEEIQFEINSWLKN